MVSQLEKEAEDDEEVYETMGCWCVTNDKAKTKSIADAETTIETLSASIETLTAESAELNTKVSNLDAQIKRATEALETAESLREKEAAEFSEFEKESLVNVAQIKAGLQALSKIHSAALLKKKATVSTVDADQLDASESGKSSSSSGGSFVNQFKTIDRFKDIQEEALAKPMHHIAGIDDKFVPTISNRCMEVSSDLIALTQSGSRPIHPKHRSYHSFHEDKLPSHIQSLLCNVFKGADASLIESQIEDSETSSSALTGEQEPASGAIFGVMKNARELRDEPAKVTEG
jgi:myosin heavy subunit